MRAKPLILLVLSLVALGLVGCSSDGDESTATTDPGASEGAGGAWEMPAPNTEPMSEADAAAVDEAMEAAFAEMEGQTPAMWFGVWDPDKGTYLFTVATATEIYTSQPIIR